MARNQPLEELTRYLRNPRKATSELRAEALEHVYSELRVVADAYLRNGRAQTLQPTALVHEAYLKLFDREALDVRDRQHFFALAARTMRQLLVDHARARNAEKRGGRREQVTLDEGLAQATQVDVDVLDLDAALAELEELDERQGRVVELRYFAGLSIDETAQLLEVSATTVEREWRFARAWLGRRLQTGNRPT